MRVHEKYVCALDVEQGWGWISTVGRLAFGSNLGETLLKQGGSHKNAILLTIIRDKREDTSRTHVCLMQ
jgi:hypothetical protein